MNVDSSTITFDDNEIEIHESNSNTQTGSFMRRCFSWIGNDRLVDVKRRLPMISQAVTLSIVAIGILLLIAFEASPRNDQVICHRMVSQVGEMAHYLSGNQTDCTGDATFTLFSPYKDDLNDIIACIDDIPNQAPYYFGTAVLTPVPLIHSFFKSRISQQYYPFSSQLRCSILSLISAVASSVFLGLSWIRGFPGGANGSTIRDSFSSTIRSYDGGPCHTILDQVASQLVNNQKIIDHEYEIAENYFKKFTVLVVMTFAIAINTGNIYHFASEEEKRLNDGRGAYRRPQFSPEAHSYEADIDTSTETSATESESL